MIGYRCSSLKALEDDYKSYIVCTVNTTTGVETEYNLSVASAFANNTEFDSLVEVGNHVNNCSFMLANCNKFNNEVQFLIPSSVTDCSGLYSGCTNFNLPVTIPNSVVNCASMFQHCQNFNQPIVIPNSIITCFSILYNCGNFNSSVVIGNAVTNMSQSFAKCISFNQDLVIPPTVTSVYMMFLNAFNFGRDIYFKGTSYRNISVYGMFYNCNNTKRKNIWFNNVLNSVFNIDNRSSVVGTSILWTPMTNGFYNSAFNIYCYSNYSG